MRDFRCGESGTISLFSVFMLMAILILTGASVDLMRYEASRTKMQNVMDRAVLAAADLDQTRDPQVVVEDYLGAAGLGSVLSDVTVVEATNARTVSATGAGDINTFFMKLSGYDTLSAREISAADERVANVEISLAFDVSGSMLQNGRVDKAKEAAQSFVDKVMDEDSVGVTTLNLIPFAGSVNPGDVLFDYFLGIRPDIPEVPDPEGEPEVVDNGDYFEPWDQAISNVVLYFDTDGDEIYDRAHKIQDFPESAPRDMDEFYQGAVAYAVANDPELTSTTQFLGGSIKGGVQSTKYFQVQGDENGPTSDLGPTKNKGKIPGSTYSYGSIDFETWAPFYVSPNLTDPTETQHVNMPSSCVEIYDSEFGTTEMPQSNDFIPHFQHWSFNEEKQDWGWCPGEDTAVLYFQDDPTALKNYIADMRVHDGTGTQYAMKYALALLDPTSRDEVSHLISEGLVDSSYEGRPKNWDDAETEKYVVVMSDGKTATQYRPTDPDAIENGYVELSVQGPGTYYNFSSESANVSNLLEQCELAKTLGVTVFTIAFETSASTSADLAQCASSVSHFFHVQGDEIYDAFDMVARQINNLRLIQ